MNKKIVVALFVLMLVLLSSCASASDNLVWYESFDDQEAGMLSSIFSIFSQENTETPWLTDVDMNYVCEEYLPSPEHTLFLSNITEDSPSGDNMVGLMAANPEGSAAYRVNAINHRRFEVVDQSTYVLTGYMRAAPGYDLEMINPALEFVVDGIGYYAEIVYYLNPYVNQETHMAIGVPYYAGLMYTRGPSAGNMNFLMEMGDDSEWHWFALQVSVDFSSDTPFAFDRAVIDYFAEDGAANQDHNFVNKYFDNVPLWSEDKGEYVDGGQVFLEVHNMNTNCDPELSFIGVGLWDDIALYRYPLGEAPTNIPIRP